MQQHLDGQSREDGCVDAHIADTLMTPTLFSQHSYSLKCCKIWWKHQWTVQHFGELLTFCFRYEHINTVLSGKKLSPWPTKGPQTTVCTCMGSTHATINSGVFKTVMLHELLTHTCCHITVFPQSSACRELWRWSASPAVLQQLCLSQTLSVTCKL